MPIIECDPWREQYFERVPCPPHVVVPTDDPESWRLFPAHRWVFNKLNICATQGIEHAPHGVAPARYPVFSKPIYNLRGMGAQARVLRNEQEYAAAVAPGHMWMTLLEGEHVSTDAAVVHGEACWWRHAYGAASGQGMFDYWEVAGEARADLERPLGRWLRTHLGDYTGMVNIETIDGHIIECHLRFADQWPDLYGGDPWVNAVVELYSSGRWQYDDSSRRTGFSVVLWGSHAARRRVPHRALIDSILHEAAVSSVQITFHVAPVAESQSMPVGGFRLAIVNCWELAAGRAARERLQTAILADQRSTAK